MSLEASLSGDSSRLGVENAALHQRSKNTDERPQRQRNPENIRARQRNSYGDQPGIDSSRRRGPGENLHRERPWSGRVHYEGDTDPRRNGPKLQDRGHLQNLPEIPVAYRATAAADAVPEKPAIEKVENVKKNHDTEEAEDEDSDNGTDEDENGGITEQKKHGHNSWRVRHVEYHRNSQQGQSRAQSPGDRPWGAARAY